MITQHNVILPSTDDLTHSLKQLPRQKLTKELHITKISESKTAFEHLNISCSCLSCHRKVQVNVIAYSLPCNCLRKTPFSFTFAALNLIVSLLNTPSAFVLCIVHLFVRHSCEFCMVEGGIRSTHLALSPACECPLCWTALELSFPVGLIACVCVAWKLS